MVGYSPDTVLSPSCAVVIHLWLKLTCLSWLCSEGPALSLLAEVEFAFFHLWPKMLTVNLGAVAAVSQVLGWGWRDWRNPPCSLYFLVVSQGFWRMILSLCKGLFYLYGFFFEGWIRSTDLFLTYLLPFSFPFRMKYRMWVFQRSMDACGEHSFFSVKKASLLLPVSVSPPSLFFWEVLEHISFTDRRYEIKLWINFFFFAPSPVSGIS